MIHSHLYTNKKDTPIYATAGGNGEPISYLGLNNWVGVLEKNGNWYHVLSILHQGWIHVDNVEERSPFNLHVHWEPGKPIEYVCAA